MRLYKPTDKTQLSKERARYLPGSFFMFNSVFGYCPTVFVLLIQSVKVLDYKSKIWFLRVQNSTRGNVHFNCLFYVYDIYFLRVKLMTTDFVHIMVGLEEAAVFRRGRSNICQITLFIN